MAGCGRPGPAPRACGRARPGGWSRMRSPYSAAIRRTAASPLLAGSAVDSDLEAHVVGLPAAHAPAGGYVRPLGPEPVVEGPLEIQELGLRIRLRHHPQPGPNRVDVLGRHGALDGANEALVHGSGIEGSGAEAHVDGPARIVEAHRSSLAAEFVEDDLERPNADLRVQPGARGAGHPPRETLELSIGRCAERRPARLRDQIPGVSATAGAAWAAAVTTQATPIVARARTPWVRMARRLIAVGNRSARCPRVRREVRLGHVRAT